MGKGEAFSSKSKKGCKSRQQPRQRIMETATLIIPPEKSRGRVRRWLSFQTGLPCCKMRSYVQKTSWKSSFSETLDRKSKIHISTYGSSKSMRIHLKWGWISSKTSSWAARKSGRVFLVAIGLVTAKSSRDYRYQRMYINNTRTYSSTWFIIPRRTGNNTGLRKRRLHKPWMTP